LCIFGRFSFSRDVVLVVVVAVIAATVIISWARWGALDVVVSGGYLPGDGAAEVLYVM